MALVLAVVFALVVVCARWSGFGRSRQILPTVALLSNAQHGSTSGVVRVQLNKGHVRLQVEVVNPLPNASYQLQIRHAGGRTLFSVDGLGVHRLASYAYVETTVPAAVFGPGRRIIRVSGPGTDFQWTEQVSRA